MRIIDLENFLAQKLDSYNHTEMAILKYNQINQYSQLKFNIMKTKLASLLVVLLITTTQCMAQKRVTVEAQNDDISNNLDLKAVATAFGESSNLENFEQKLNDYDSGISNLDLNNDGQVDYLRVIEKNENNIHVVVIQAVLDKDVYQDVASIVVDKDQDSNTTVQIIGDPYLYGDNYIIEPSYLYTPSIFSFFWGANYYNWHSPYYWGYYPSYYHHRRPYDQDIYRNNVYAHINHDQRYYYTNRIRDNRALVLQNSIGRNDYAVRYPDRNFSSRNVNVRNKRDFEFNRNGVVRNPQSGTSYQGNSSGNRNTKSYNNGSQNSQSNGWNQRNSTQRTYTPSNEGRNNVIQNRLNENNIRLNSGNVRNQNNSNTRTYSAPTNNSRSNVNPNVQQNSNSQPRQNTSTRPAPVVQQRTRTVESRPAVQRQPENNRNSEQRSGNKSENRSSGSDSNRR
jgi:hypothetical protein